MEEGDKFISFINQKEFKACTACCCVSLMKWPNCSRESLEIEEYISASWLRLEPIWILFSPNWYLYNQIYMLCQLFTGDFLKIFLPFLGQRQPFCLKWKHKTLDSSLQAFEIQGIYLLSLFMLQPRRSWKTEDRRGLVNEGPHKYAYKQPHGMWPFVSRRPSSLLGRANTSSLGINRFTSLSETKAKPSLSLC